MFLNSICPYVIHFNPLLDPSVFARLTVNLDSVIVCSNEKIHAACFD